MDRTASTASSLPPRHRAPSTVGKTSTLNADFRVGKPTHRCQRRKAVFPLSGRRSCYPILGRLDIVILADDLSLPSTFPGPQALGALRLGGGLRFWVSRPSGVATEIPSHLRVQPWMPTLAGGSSWT